jgi:hypothetical protein
MSPRNVFGVVLTLVGLAPYVLLMFTDCLITMGAVWRAITMLGGLLLIALGFNLAFFVSKYEESVRDEPPRTNPRLRSGAYRNPDEHKNN